MLARAGPLPGPDPRRPVALPPDRRPARRRRAASSPSRCSRRRGLAALAFVFRRWPILLPLAIVAALPFRVPLEAGGDTANLLVPLYLVIAGGVLATALGVVARTGGRRRSGGWDAGRRASLAGPCATGPAGQSTPASWLPRRPGRGRRPLCRPDALLRRTSPKGLQNVCFFFVPFSLVYALLRDVSWDRRLLTLRPAGWSRSRRSSSSLVGSVEYVDPQPVLERPGDPVERIPHLLPGQLGLLGPEHLWALPGAGDRRRDGGAALGARAARPGAAARRWSRCSGSAWCRPSRSRASPPCSPAWPCSPPCAGACAGRSPRSAPAPSPAVARRARWPAALEDQPLDRHSTSTPAAAPTWSRAGSSSSPSARSGATARAPSRAPTASTSQTPASAPVSDLPHRADHGRRRAGPDRAGRLPRTCSSPRF